uniref:15-oxoprostaglandin 13-reductase n=1 Tax=Strigamia maritima TaxID=126957 RepID=T1J6C8_STRMM
MLLRRKKPGQREREYKRRIKELEDATAAIVAPAAISAPAATVMNGTKRQRCASTHKVAIAKRRYSEANIIRDVSLCALDEAETNLSELTVDLQERRQDVVKIERDQHNLKALHITQCRIPWDLLPQIVSGLRLETFSWTWNERNAPSISPPEFLKTLRLAFAQLKNLFIQVSNPFHLTYVWIMLACTPNLEIFEVNEVISPMYISVTNALQVFRSWNEKSEVVDTILSSLKEFKIFLRSSLGYTVKDFISRIFHASFALNSQVHGFWASEAGCNALMELNENQGITLEKIKDAEFLSLSGRYVRFLNPPHLSDNQLAFAKTVLKNSLPNCKCLCLDMQRIDGDLVELVGAGCPQLECLSLMRSYVDFLVPPLNLFTKMMESCNNISELCLLNTHFHVQENPCIAIAKLKNLKVLSLSTCILGVKKTEAPLNENTKPENKPFQVKQRKGLPSRPTDHEILDSRLYPIAKNCTKIHTLIIRTEDSNFSWLEQKYDIPLICLQQSLLKCTKLETLEIISEGGQHQRCQQHPIIEVASKLPNLVNLYIIQPTTKEDCKKITKYLEQMLKDIRPAFRCEVASSRRGNLFNEGSSQNHGYLGINATDINITAGKYFGLNTPGFVPGLEAVGEIAGIGEKVTNFKNGQPVAFIGLGCYAEYMCVSSELVYKIPEVKPEYLGSLVCGNTACIGLDKVGKIKAGDKVLITAAAGGTGHLCVQYAKEKGCHVAGLCSSDEKATFLKDIDCDRPINYKQENLGEVLKREYPNGIDVVWETVGGDVFTQCVDNLAIKGRLIIVGYISNYKSESGTNRNLEGLPAKLLSKSASVNGFARIHYTNEYAAYHAKWLSSFQDNKIKVKLDQGEKLPTGVFRKLDSVAAAVEYLHSGQSIGKVYVEI